MYVKDAHVASEDEVAGFRETLPQSVLSFVLEFAVFVLDVLAPTVQESHVQPFSFLLTSSLKTKLLDFLACFSSMMTLLRMSAELQSLSALFFCIIVKSCCIFPTACEKELLLLLM